MQHDKPKPADDPPGAHTEPGLLTDRERLAAPLVQAAGGFDDIEDEALNAFHASLLGANLHGLLIRETSFTTQAATAGIARGDAPGREMVLISLRDQVRLAAPAGPHNALVALTPAQAARAWALPLEPARQVLHQVTGALTTARQVASSCARMRAAQVTALEIEARIEHRAAATGVEASWLMNTRQQAARVQMWQAAIAPFRGTAMRPAEDVAAAARRVRVLTEDLAALRRSGLTGWIANQPTRGRSQLADRLAAVLRIGGHARAYRRQLRAVEHGLDAAIEREHAARMLADAVQGLADARALTDAQACPKGPEEEPQEATPATTKPW
ncbi:hypothetical protein [Myceligenerans pegani]|uniref:DUF222 domain-containing protein n=1 Tax=Myceligenerans pegani TaxID=2776917 RepID=A0ABR9N5N3_9MICO|nr:hypothetical protein [Myceligenerans sp. TRM 65318]MBE1878972.1 hypothetical protein [Myceligenerans sp. TRM 65318]MBE3021243.1 hypothetical protein [Myceligenerans sp. TRM 65318]